MDRRSFLIGSGSILTAAFVDKANWFLRNKNAVVPFAEAEDAVKKLYFVDQGGEGDPRIDQFNKIAPVRFQKVYFEGMAVSVATTKSERSPQLRKDALAHHGETCMACEFVPEVLRQLEVHHLDPLADRGPSHTILNDVAVLCRNCHGLAHSTNPPIPLAELKLRAKKSKKKRPGLSMI